MTSTPPPGVCRDCHATVRWIELESGRWQPLDPIACRDGNVVVVDRHDGPVGFVARRGRPIPGGARRYRSHFATCNPGTPKLTPRNPSLFDDQEVDA